MGIISKFFDRIDSVAYFLLLSSAVQVAMAWKGRKRLVGRVSQLLLYPVKSIAGIEMDHLECCTPGAQVGRFGDRHFIVVEGDKNTCVTARTEPTMLLIKPRLNDNELYLTAPDMEPLVINLDVVEASSKLINGSVHGSPVAGLDCGVEASTWISRFLQKPGHRLMFASPSVEKRSVRNGPAKFAEWTTNIDTTNKMAYQDCTTYLILSESTVDDLNSRIDRSRGSVSTDNFRPNIVVSDTSAYAEDNWTKVYVGEAEFSPVKLCSRCLLTTIDPKSATKSPSQEPLVTLRSYRKLVPSFGDSPCFGVNLVLDKLGTIRVGDAVYAVIGQPKLTP